MKKRSWFVSAFISLAFVHVFAWYRVPVQFYLRHSEDFATPLPQLANTSVMFGALSLLVTVSVSYFVFLAVRKPAAVVFTSLAFTFWIINSLFGQFDPVIDDNFQRVDLEQYRAVIEFLIFAILLALLFRYRRYLHPAGSVLLLLGAVYYGGSTIRQVTASELKALSSPEAESIYSVSANRNLLVIQMAGFQSDYFSEWLVTDPGLANMLDGFYYFPDTLGVASRPGPLVDAAIQSGHHYNPFVPLNTVRAELLDGGSVFSKLAMAGADVRIFQRDRACPYLARCIHNGEIIRDTTQVHLGETLYAVDSALLIMAPEALKNFIYRQGRWLLGSMSAGGGPDGPRKSVFHDHAFLQMFASKLRPGHSDSSVTYIQLENTRAPAVMSENCKVIPGAGKHSRQRVFAQARCALRDLSRLIDTLKKNNIYHTTAIVVLADTGAVFPGVNTSLEGQFADTEQRQNISSFIASANPLLLIKPMDSTGPLRLNDQPASLADIPRTLCGLTGMCRWPSGKDLVSSSEYDPGPRQYLEYSAGQYNKNLGLISDAVQYQLSGPVADPDSWNRVIDNGSVDYVAELNFSSLDDPAVFGDGWGVVEIDPTAGSKRWAAAKSTSLTLSLSPDWDYLLEFTVYPAPGIDKQSMQLHINGHWAGRHFTTSGVNTLTYRIPSAYVLPGTDSIDLEFANLAKPAGPDERELAMSFFLLKIGRVEHEYVLEPL